MTVPPWAVSRLIGVAMVLLLTGCGTSYEYQDYRPPQGASTVEVGFRALDKYRNADYIEVSLYRRSSCQQKPLLQSVAEMQTTAIWEDDVYRAVNRLPARENLALHLYNSSDSGYVVSKCENLQAYVLGAGYRYEMRIKNWSSAGTGYSTFGCEFDLHRLDPAGNAIESVLRVKPAIATCE